MELLTKNRTEIEWYLSFCKPCKVTGATLIVGRLDRLSRDVSFVTSLQKAGTKFIAADLPEANEMMIDRKTHV